MGPLAVRLPFERRHGTSLEPLLPPLPDKTAVDSQTTHVLKQATKSVLIWVRPLELEAGVSVARALLLESANLTEEIQ